MAQKRNVVVLGCNFAGLTVSRYLHSKSRGALNITVIDKKNYINFIPNIPIEVFNDHNPADNLEFRFAKFLKSDKSEFIQAEVTEIDPVAKKVRYRPDERDGNPTETISYDYLVIALGCRLAYDEIEGFAEYGHTFSDTYYGNKIREYLDNGYKGGPIVIGSDKFIQGKSPKLPKMPVAVAACEGPPVELAFSFADWLKRKKMGDAKKITLFTPGEVIAEDAGKKILDQLLPMVSQMGFHYINNTGGIRRIYKEGIEFKNGAGLEAELKVIFPNWKAHDILKNMPFTDDQGFVVTDLYMRNPDFPEIFAVGDAASLTVPKLGAIGHMEAEIVAEMISNEAGEKYDVQPLSPMVICFGDMGSHKGFYMHTNEWWGGDISVLKMGYIPYFLKMGFKNMYYTLGGKVPGWGMPLAELMADHTFI